MRFSGLPERKPLAPAPVEPQGESITDLSSNSSSLYCNFDSFDQISGDHGRRRRLGAVERPGHQPRDQERQQRIQGDAQLHLRERRDAVAQNLTKELFDAMITLGRRPP